MRAIILAAGRGRRMGASTEQIPKCMLQLQGKPLICWQVEAMQEAGIQDIAVVAGYKAEKIIAPGIVQFFKNERWHETNMVRSLMAADLWLSESDCIISYSDIFYSASAIASLIDNTSEIAITYDPHFKSLWEARFEQPLDDLETFRFDKENFLTTIGEKPLTIDEVQGQYMGLLKFTPQGWKQTKCFLSNLTDQRMDQLDMTTLLRSLILAGHAVQVVAYHERWGEIDHETDLLLYQGEEA